MYIDLALVLSQALLEDKQSRTEGYLYTLILRFHKKHNFSSIF